MTEKFHLYNDYLKAKTKFLVEAADLGDYDLYVTEDENNNSYRVVYHENIPMWQDGIVKDGHINDKERDWFNHCIIGYNYDLEEPIDSSDPNSPLTDNEYWKNAIDELVGM